MCVELSSSFAERDCALFGQQHCFAHHHCLSAFLHNILFLLCIKPIVCWRNTSKTKTRPQLRWITCFAVLLSFLLLCTIVWRQSCRMDLLYNYDKSQLEMISYLVYLTICGCIPRTAIVSFIFFYPLCQNIPQFRIRKLKRSKRICQIQRNIRRHRQFRCDEAHQYTHTKKKTSMYSVQIGQLWNNNQMNERRRDREVYREYRYTERNLQKLANKTAA